MKTHQLNKLPIAALLLACALVSSCSASGGMDRFDKSGAVDLRKASNGCINDVLPKGNVKTGGADASRKLIFPKFEKMWFASADGMYSEKFPYTANRLNPWIMGPDFAREFDKSPSQDAVYVSAGRNGEYALLKLSDGNYMALLPITGARSMAWIYADKSGEMFLKASNFGTENLEGPIPLMAVATEKSPYDAVRRVWEIAMGHPEVKGRMKNISEKKYPEQFKYLGWCSWEQYKKDITLDLLCDTVKGIEKSGVPVRWFLVDDGFQTQSGLRLKSFKPEEAKFPGGWEKLLALRNPEKVKWFGLWHCYYGLWTGIDLENDFGALNETFIKSDAKTLVPGATKDGAKKFYDAFMGSVADYGFDFVKIDVQTGYINKAHASANAVEANNWCSEALENVCNERLGGLINCMAHNGATFFNAKHSSIIRCSVDYFKGRPNTAKSHLYQSYQNTVWLGHLYWPDHDMFHSSDSASSKDMAVSKALSGAPVYLSDSPDHFVKELIMNLCYDDGEILRPLAPAVPLPESIFMQPLSNKKNAYRVIAPLANGSTAIMLHNLCQSPDRNPVFKNGMSLTTAEQHVDADPKIPVKAWVSEGDYELSGVMMQPKAESWKAPKEGLVWYDWYAKKGGKLSGKVEFTIEKPLDGKLILLCPIRDGWALVGLTKKFLSPAAIEKFETTQNSCSVKMREGGEFAVYSVSKPKCGGVELTPLGGNLWLGVSKKTEFTLTR